MYVQLFGKTDVPQNTDPFIYLFDILGFEAFPIAESPSNTL